MKSGFYISGRFKGVRTHEWKSKSGAQGVDTLIGIAFDSEDGYGETREVLTEIKVYKDEITRAMVFESMHKGKDVIVGCVPLSKKFGDKSWIEYAFTRNCQLYLSPEIE